MQKPTSLRKALMSALPELRDQPDRLVIWVEDGAVRCRETPDHGFAFEYPLAILISEASTDIAIIAHAVNRWLRVNQPDRLTAGQGDSYKFEADILDNATADIALTIQLTEDIKVAEMPDGSWSIDYLVEPDPLFEDGEAIDPAATAPPLSSVDTIVADD